MTSGHFNENKQYTMYHCLTTNIGAHLTTTSDESFFPLCFEFTWLVSNGGSADGHLGLSQWNGLISSLGPDVDSNYSHQSQSA